MPFAILVAAVVVGNIISEPFEAMVSNGLGKAHEWAEKQRDKIKAKLQKQPVPNA